MKTNHTNQSHQYYCNNCGYKFRSDLAMCPDCDSTDVAIDEPIIRVPKPNHTKDEKQLEQVAEKWDKEARDLSEVHDIEMTKPDTHSDIRGIEGMLEDLLHFATHECHKLKNATYRADMKEELRKKYIEPILTHFQSQHEAEKRELLQEINELQKNCPPGAIVDIKTIATRHNIDISSKE